MTSDGNGYGTGPDETPRYGVRTPGGTPHPQGPNAQGPSNQGPNNPGPSSPQQAGWDTPRQNETFGPYVPDNPPAAGGWTQPGYGPNYGQGFGPGFAPQVPARRPGQVTAASIILWIAAGLYTLLMVSGMGMLAGSDIKATLLDYTDTLPADQASLYREQFESIDNSMLSSAVYFLIVMVVAVGILAAVAAWRTWKGSNAWRIAGTVCGGAMAAYQLFTILMAPAAGFPGLAVCIVVIVLWFSKPATAWFRAQAARRP
ncbi:MAG: hypothetical protein ACTII7_01865 [Galactobacter sp.]